jgi:type II secretory pathway component PulJ
MSEILIAVISTVVSALGGALLYFLQKHFKKMENYAEVCEERRTKKDLLVLKSLKAIGDLTCANAIAIKNGHCNGELDEAKKSFESVEKELDAFILESAVKKVNTKGGK